MKRLKFIVIVLSVLLLCSCGQGNGKVKVKDTKLNSDIEPYGQENLIMLDEEQGLPSILDLIEQVSDEIEIGETPSLDGGTERSERPKSPANNRALAEAYPNIIVLNGAWTSKRIAITFDDGPDRRFTPQVLDILKKHDVKATFFLMGSRVKGHPGVTERIHQEGHVIGNHTFWHPKLYAESIERMVWEVEETNKLIKETVGYTPKLFRAPYGGLDYEHVETLGERNISVIGWSVDTEDWRQISSEEVQHNLYKNLHPGAIILMHCAGDWTQDLSGMTAALDELLPQLKKEGYEMVTVPELLGIPYKQPEEQEHGVKEQE